MSPPVKAPPEPDLAHEAARETGTPTPVPTAGSGAGTTTPPPHAAVLRGQQTAGNRAIAGVMDRPTGIQRAPNDDDPRRTSGMAHAPTLDSSGGVAIAPTLPGTSGPDPRRSGMAHGPTLDSAGGIATGTTLPGTDRGDPRRSGMAYGPTLSSGNGAALAGTLPGGGGQPAPGPSAPPAPTGGPGPSVPPGGGAPGAPGPSGPPGPAPGGDDDAVASLPGTGAPPPSRFRGPAHGLTENSIADAYRKDPNSVVRAINYAWYDWILRAQKFNGEEFPDGVRVGKAVVVAPDYDGPGPPKRTTPIEEPDEEGQLGPNDPKPGDPKLWQGPVQQRPDLSDPNAKRAIFPGSRQGPMEPGMKKAVPVTHEEVMRAYRANPNAVHPSKDDHWHDQIWNADRGQGQSPRAYRSGNQIIIDQSYPLDGRRPEDSPRGSVRLPGPGSDLGSVLNTVQIPTDPQKKAEMLKDPVQGPKLRDAINAQNERERAQHMADARRATGALAEARKPQATAPPPPPDPAVQSQQAAQTISPTGYVPQERKRAKVEVKDGALSRETTDEQKRVTGETTDTKSRSSKQSFSLAKGAGQEWKQRQEQQTGDKYNATEQSRKVNVSLQEGLKFETGKATETGTGPDAPKTKTEVKAGMTAGPGGIGGQGTAAVTSQSGAKAEGNIGAKYGKDGLELSAMGSYTTSKGFKGYMSVSGKHNVVAGDPKQLENGKYSVTFTITDSKGVEVGGGWSKPGGGGGPQVGLNAGSSTATSNYETRVFDTLPEAQMFQLTAAILVGSEKESIAKATTADGALAMKEGESKGTSQTDTDTLGGSAGMSQVSVSIASTDSTTHGLRIEKMAGNKVRVTPSVAEQEALNASISAAGVFSNTKGSSDTKTFSVTYEFDLSSDTGKRAFETYCKMRWPPPMPPNAKWINSITGHAFEDHDVYKFAGVGQIGWQDTAWQQRMVDEKGTHDVAGGVQSHKVDLNWVRHLTFDENVHSEVQIVGRLENGKSEGFQGQMTVGGESGSYNREQFGKIFMGAKAKPGVEVKNSGEWTLSADIDAKMFEQLATLNKDMRKARTREEKLKIYSELAKKGGAQMLGGQVRGGGKKLAWNLELKGDPNFPGAAGREALNAQKAKLAAQLKNQPGTAGAVAAEAKDVITALTKRLEAISDEKKYTDLPDELRQTQKDLVNDHLSQFKLLRQQAISTSMRANPKEDLTDTLNRASSKTGYDKVKKENREVDKLRDKITIHETEIAVLAKEITGTYKIVTRMFGGGPDVRWGEGVKKEVYVERNTNAKQSLSIARSMDERLKVASQKARELREKWTTQTDPKDNEANMRALDAALLEQIKILDVQLDSLREAARQAYIVTSDAAIGRDWNFYKVIKVDGEARSLAISGLTDDDL